MASEATMETVMEAIAATFEKEWSVVPPAGVARRLAGEMIERLYDTGICIHMMGDDETSTEPDSLEALFIPKDADKAPRVDATVTCPDCSQVVPLMALEQVLVVRFEATEMAAHQMVCPAQEED